MSTHPNHSHLLYPTNPTLIYPNFQGQWGCDNCGISYDRTHTPYHCTACQYDMCEKCFTPKNHPRHAHPLYLCQTQSLYPQYQGEWKCDACEERRFPQQEPLSYHCYRDEFDLCGDCFKGRSFPIHRHPLKPADSLKVYNNAPGYWICDCCKRSGSDIGSIYSWHCSECEFDCCDRCLKEIQIEGHAHPLKITDSYLIYPNYGGCWQCDVCKNDFSPRAPGGNNDKPYHCFAADCQFDACHTCVHGRTNMHRDSPGFDETGPAVHLRRAEVHAAPKPHLPPMEMTENEDDSNVENLDDSQKCIVCLSKSKSATIVHGSTGHVCCCLACANQLWRRGDKCPMCRAPIDRVIKHFNS